MFRLVLFRSLLGALIAPSPIGRPSQSLSSASVGEATSTQSGPETPTLHRWTPDGASRIGYVGAVLIIVSFWFDGHTVSKGIRPVHAVVNSVHVIGGSVALAAVVLAGVIMAILVLDSIGELTGTQWGKMLLLKTAAVGLTSLGGTYNHFKLLPALNADPNNSDLANELRSIVTAEAIMLLFVVVVTAWLVSAAS